LPETCLIGSYGFVSFLLTQNTDAIIVIVL